jgi:hypothetical protein
MGAGLSQSIDLSLYKISDTLQLPFTYTDGKVSGATDFVVGILPEFNIPIRLTASKLFASEQVGLLAHVIGDLSILVSHYPKSGMVTAYLIDGRKLHMSGVKAPPELFISKKMTLKEVVSGLGDAIVAAFYFKDGWKPLQMPK